MGVFAMKLAGEGSFGREDRRRAMRFAFRNAGVDCVTVSYESPAEIDEAIENLCMFRSTSNAWIVPSLGPRRRQRRYNALVITRGIREFVARDWTAVRESKDAYWAARIERLGPMEGLRIADELRRQMIQQHPAWPDARLRDDDVRAHARLAELFQRASPARRA